MQSLAEFLCRVEERGELSFFLIGGRSLEACEVMKVHQRRRFPHRQSGDHRHVGPSWQSWGSKGSGNQHFYRWKHPSMAVEDVDVMYVQPDTFQKLLQDCTFLKIASARLRVPGIPSLISLKLHAIKSNPDRVEKDGRDIADLIKSNPGILNRPELEALFAKYSCSSYFPQFEHLAS